MNEDLKLMLIDDINIKIGGDINDLSEALSLERDLLERRTALQSSLRLVNNEVPNKISLAVAKAESNSTQIANLKNRSETLKLKVKDFLERTEPLRTELDKRFTAINRLEHVLVYLKSFVKIDDISRQMKQCNDDEQLVLWYAELKEMCILYQSGHRATYVKEYTHYWHNILKDKMTKSYEDTLKLIKWPLAAGAQNSPPPKEILIRFNNLTRYLFLIEEPESVSVASVSGEFGQEQDPCLPVRILLRPFKKRFAFHFTGSRQTARIDRPEWFLTQTLNWIKHHQNFVRNNVQPVADKLELKKIKTVDEFNDGLIALAAERLHTVLGLYHAQNAKGDLLDADAAFAHAVDETLGFHRELMLITDNETNNVLAVLTKAEIFVKWLAVEKKYALAKMDETLSSEQWSEAVAAGIGSAVGAMVWVPRGADWFIALLKTIEDRYVVLPQPGHRLQFLELQLELVEEWRVRLTQLLNAAVSSLRPETFLTADSSPHPLTAVINATHHTRTTLIQWAHSLHYLQLHYYRRQFNHFTQLQHLDNEAQEQAENSSAEEESEASNVTGDLDSTAGRRPSNVPEDKVDLDDLAKKRPTLKEVELHAKKLAMKFVEKSYSLMSDLPPVEIQIPDFTGRSSSPIASMVITTTMPENPDAEDAGVFGEAPSLLARLRDSGLADLSEHILLEFKAGLRDYKKLAWHACLVVEEMALSVSAPLCRPLAALCARLGAASARLAPALAARLRARLANDVDQYIFEVRLLTGH
ncbi:RAD50-interacting protein 1 [Ostrinia nubilalis]|uniref:RAD50-interacting protein 1 n=1 Tax=Ostrinia nubilalis TaxID=29057 RepID=UPI0030826080